MSEQTQITRKSIMTFLTNVLHEAEAVQTPGLIGTYALRFTVEGYEICVSTSRPEDAAVNLPSPEQRTVELTEEMLPRYVELWQAVGDVRVETGTFIYDGLKAWGFAAAMANQPIAQNQAAEYPYSFCFTDGAIGVYFYVCPMTVSAEATEAAEVAATEQVAE